MRGCGRPVVAVGIGDRHAGLPPGLERDVLKLDPIVGCNLNRNFFAEDNGSPLKTTVPLCPM